MNQISNVPDGGRLTAAVLAKTAVISAFFIVTLGIAGRFDLAGQSGYGHLLGRQLFYMLSGGGIFAIVYGIGNERIWRYCRWYVIALVLLIAAGWASPYSRMFQYTFVRIGGITVAPVDAANFVLVVLLAKEWSTLHGKRRWLLLLSVAGVLLMLAASGVRLPLPLLVTAILTMLSLADLFPALLCWELFIACLVAQLLLIRQVSPEVWQRLSAFLTPDLMQDSCNYYLTLSVNALQNLNCLGNSDPAAVAGLNYQELIFPLLAVRSGWLFAALLLGGYIVLSLSLAGLVFKLRDQREKLLVAGFAVLIIVPVCYYFLMITGLAPMVRINLPLLGGSASHLWFVTAALGMIANTGNPAAVPDTVDNNIVNWRENCPL